MAAVGTRAVLAFLLMLAIAVRTAVPAGWMPTIDERGFTLSPCSSWAPAAIVSTADHGAHGDHGPDTPEKSEHDASTQPCAFAALAVDVPFAGSEAAFAIGSASGGAIVRNDVVSVGRGLAAPPPPSTGPPNFA